MFEREFNAVYVARGVGRDHLIGMGAAVIVDEDDRGRCVAKFRAPSTRLNNDWHPFATDEFFLCDPTSRSRGRPYYAGPAEDDRSHARAPRNQFGQARPGPG